MIDSFRAFALEGLFLPAFLVAFGSAAVLHARHRRPLASGELARAHPVIRYLATRNWERPCGYFVVGAGLLIAVLRLTR